MHIFWKSYNKNNGQEYIEDFRMTYAQAWYIQLTTTENN